MQNLGGQTKSIWYFQKWPNRPYANHYAEGVESTAFERLYIFAGFQITDSHISVFRSNVTHHIPSG